MGQRETIYKVQEEEAEEEEGVIQGYRKRWTGFETAIT